MNTNYISQILLKKKIDSETKTLFIFNPEHDLAMAVGRGPYTPPAEIAKLKKDFSLLPSLFAGNGDFILLPADISLETISTLPYYETVISKNINLILPFKLLNYKEKIGEVIPWGWDFSVYNELISSGLDHDLLPDKKVIDKIRDLSHRRNSILMFNQISSLLNLKTDKVPVEIFSLSEADRFITNQDPFFYKAPWSSSGRGIVLSTHISQKGLKEWIHGIIRRQGSVIVEPAWDKLLDFATEWIIRDKEPIFLGYSVFKTSERGKYHGNIRGNQTELLQLIQEKVPAFDSSYIEAQYEVLKTQIAPFYEGFLGIDMLADNSGKINPCVELNLRLTMGHIPIISN